MPTPTLTTIDLSDPSPPVPGDRERAAVRARATQLGRRRRVAQGASALAVVVIVALGAAALTAGGSGTAPVAILQVKSSTLEPRSTVQVDLKNGDSTVSGEADASGTVHFGHDIAPGTYSVFVTVDGPPAGPTERGVDIGTARIAYRSITMTLDAGVNTLDLGTLTPL
ncbi:MAG: hypothetical protein WD271_17135 [Acidimicrobiia bacterium]